MFPHEAGHVKREYWETVVGDDTGKVDESEEGEGTEDEEMDDGAQEDSMEDAESDVREADSE